MLSNDGSRLPVAISVPCSCSRLEFPHVHNNQCREWVYSFAPFVFKVKGRRIDAQKDEKMSMRQEIPQPPSKTPAPRRSKKKVG